MAPVTPVAVTAAPATAVERLSKFIADNKTLVYGVSAATILVIAGASAYYITYKDKSAPPSSDSPKVKSAAEKRKARNKKKNRKKQPDASISSEDKSISTGSSTSISAGSGKLPDISGDLSILPESTLKDYSLEYKNAGNTEFKAKNYQKAIEHYTTAIGLYKDAVYYSNRAACANALENWQDGVDDCDAALALDPTYVKALSRRALAYEKLERFQDSLVDYTAAALLSPTQSESLGKSIDSVMLKCAKERADPIVADRKKVLPSISFVTAYIDSFHPREMPEACKTAEPESGDDYLRLAIEASELKSLAGHEQAFELLTKAIEKKTTELSLAYELRGTLEFLMADNTQSLVDLTESISISPSVKALVKRAMLFIELSEPNKAAADFTSAVALDANDPDIYYHQGQVHFLMTDYNEAARDYQKAIDLDKNFASSHIQLAVTQYKLGSLDVALAGFKKCIQNFSKSPDVFNYYGEILMDLQRFPEAVEQFDRAYQLEKSNKKNGINVLPLINKAFVILSFGLGTPQEAEELLREALVMDPQSDMAVGTMAQLMLTQNRVEEAIKYYEKQLDLARTESEILQAASYLEALVAQMKLLERYPAVRERMAAMANSAAGATAV
ncbi:mitochondrial import receptor subunit tom70 [Lipomyces oligophaga]|uniref:mitochondrial import receptor subunit tom70 n=1 Tax=Lipomyces oligophaga TaxID=45792 RepID=UPI0034D01C13